MAVFERHTCAQTFAKIRTILLESWSHPCRQIEVLDGNGAVFAINEAFPYFPHAQGVILQEKRLERCALGSELPPQTGQNRR
jgi:hypothetical protein